MKLINRADGVDGHYCIGRIHSKLGAPYWEYYFKGQWCSAGEVLTKNEAKSIKKFLETREAEIRVSSAR